MVIKNAVNRVLFVYIEIMIAKNFIITPSLFYTILLNHFNQALKLAPTTTSFQQWKNIYVTFTKEKI
jgi:hypothetical protein